MALKNSSVATIEAPEFVDITPCNNLISKCEIKVLYVGQNRNHSFISKETAKQMANTLPGVPIVAAYRKEEDDFGDHGHVITIENGEVKFTCNTVPYGFVAPDAEVWFKKFVDTDEFGNQVEREYLMTSGYLWTGQYPEIQKVLTEGMPQSMELDEDSLDGRWATDNNSGVEFFIINDATFSKLCVLGTDVEPCFEGASVENPRVVKQFSETPEFVKELLAMRQELNYALQNEGGSDMPKDQMVEEINEELPVVEFEDATGDEGATGEADSAENETSSEDAPTTDTPVEEEPPAQEEETEDAEEPDAEDEVAEATYDPALDNGDGAPMKKEFELEAEPEVEFAAEDSEEQVEEEESEFACGKKKKFAEEEKEEESEEETESEDEEKEAPKTEHSLEDVEAKFAAAQAELESVRAQLESANAELESLRSFKLGIENQQKDALIAKYHMLSDADKAEIIENKTEYSLDEIEAKLALLYVKKNVDFSTLTGEPEVQEEVETSPITTFSLDSAVDMSFVGSDSLGEILLADRNRRN